MRILKNIWSELISLLVDDGFLAIAALVAIAIAWLLSRESVMGTSDAVGWTLFGLLAGSTVVSCKRAIEAYNQNLDEGSG